MAQALHRPIGSRGRARARGRDKIAQAPVDHNGGGAGLRYPIRDKIAQAPGSIYNAGLLV